MKLISSVALAALFLVFSSAQAANVGPDFAISTENGDQTEPSIAVDLFLSAPCSDLYIRRLL